MTWLWGIRRFAHFKVGKDGLRHDPAIYINTYIALRTMGLWVQGSEHWYRWSIQFAEQRKTFGHNAGGGSANFLAVDPR
jgi:hypothetical protein